MKVTLSQVRGARPTNAGNFQRYHAREALRGTLIDILGPAGMALSNREIKRAISTRTGAAKRRALHEHEAAQHAQS